MCPSMLAANANPPWCLRLVAEYNLPLDLLTMAADNAGIVDWLQLGRNHRIDMA